MIKWTRPALKLIRAQAQMNFALVDQAAVSLANFITGILAARYLGIEEFGRFTLMWLVVQFAGCLQFASINAPMMSIGPKKLHGNTQSYYTAVFFCQIVFCFFCLASTLIGVWILEALTESWQAGVSAVALASATAGACLQDFFRRYFFTIGTAGRALGIDLIRYVGQVAILTGLATSGLYEVKASHLLWILAFTSIIGALPGLPNLPRFTWKPRQIRIVMLEHWHFGKWLLGSVLMSWAQRSIFQIAAGMLLGAGAVGGLKAAQMLLGPAQIFIQALENFVPVEAARRYVAEGRKALALYLRLVAGIGGLVVLATSLVFLVAPGLWLQLLYGSDFIGYGHLVYWYFISYLAAFLGVPLGAGLRALNYTMPLFYSYGAAMVVAFLSAYPLSWAFGPSGNAFGTALAALVTQVILWQSFRHKLAATTREADFSREHPTGAVEPPGRSPKQ